MDMILIAALLGYLFGSIPFGLVLSKAAGHGDIRKIGSGNIGATNVLRTGDKRLAFTVLLLDGGKGAIAVLMALTFASVDAAIAAGVAAILGHMFPVWLKFKGGKGVATTLGMLLALAPLVGLLACLTWLLTALVFRYSSLAALMAMLISPAAAYVIYHNENLTGALGFIAMVVWLRHRANIKRLIKGEEPKIGKKNKDDNNEAKAA